MQLPAVNVVGTGTFILNMVNEIQVCMGHA